MLNLLTEEQSNLPSSSNLAITSSTPSSPRSSQPSPPPTRHQISTNSDVFHLDSCQEPFDPILKEPESTGVFLDRVGKIPLVNGVVKAYERGKDTSKVVRYGADLVASSVNSLSDTVVSKVGPQRIAQIDRYAGAALGRLGQLSQLQHSSSDQIHLDVYHPHLEKLDHLNSTHHMFNPSSPSKQSDLRHQKSNTSLTHHDQILHHPNHSPSANSLDEHQTLDSDRNSRSTGDHLNPDHIYHQVSLHPTSSHPSHTLFQAATTANTTPVNCKSRWQNIFVEAGLTAGGISAAISTESMKSLQYCLHWLLYATSHLDHQITILRNFISSLDAEGEEEEECLTYGMRRIEAMTRLTDVKKEVVETIRKVVDVVSKYAPVGLPEPAREFVRRSILGLPLRWASAIRVTPFIHCSSELDSHEINPSPVDQPQTRLPPRNQSHPSAQFAAHRVLTFAIESLNVLKSITGTFSESVERADAWIRRLRLIGFQNRNDQEPAHHTQQEQERQYKWESNWKHVQQAKEERSYRMKDKSGDAPNFTSGRLSQPRSRSLDRYQQFPRARSRSSSRSNSTTVEEDNLSLMGEKSMIGSCFDCDMSTIESRSLISSYDDTTLASCTSNNNQLIYQDLFTEGSADRSVAKRRKANGNLINRLHPVIINPLFPFLSSPSQIRMTKASASSSSPTSCCNDDETMDDDDEKISNSQQDLQPDHLAQSRESHAFQSGHPSLNTSEHNTSHENHFLSSVSIPTSSSSASSKLIHSTSLKKILLDTDLEL